MELIDIVDENGNFTGVVMDKEEAHDKNLLHNEVAIFIINEKKQVLLEKRSANKRFDPNKWALCAGHVDSKESLENAALRELKEEVGLNISITDLKPFAEKELSKKEKNSHITHFFYVKSNLKENEFVIQKEELSEVKWFFLDDVIDMIKSHDETIVFTEKRIHLFESLKEI